jgi:hypothetical protein
MINSNDTLDSMMNLLLKSLEPFFQPNKIEPSHGVFSVDLVLLLVVSIIVVPYVFYQIRGMVPYPVKSSLQLTDYYILMILLVYLVIGVYQHYFWTKQNKLRKEIVIPRTKLDEIIHSFFEINDSWTYIYNFIYYFVFGFIIVSIKDYKHFAILVLGGIALMSGLSLIWYFFPNIVDDRMKANNYFLQKTQLIDENKNNACPSAHVVFAMYSFYLLRNVIGWIPAAMIPLLISISCLTTTQHVSTDVILGVLYTVFGYEVVLKKISPTVFK